MKSGRLALRRQFLTRIARIHGLSEAEALRLTSTPSAPSARLNPLSPRPLAEVRAALLATETMAPDPLPWCPDAHVITGDKRRITESPLFTEGHVYVQNASSLVPPLWLAPRPGERLLDVCAAPGGKTLHLAALTGNGADLWANDAHPQRVRTLETLLATYHARVAGVLRIEGQYLDKHLTEPFDRILLDAQCSGEGMLDLSHPNALRYWSLGRITKYSYLQKRMLVAAFRCLRPGGVLVYSTCTYAPEENEWPVSQLLTHHPTARTEPLPFSLPEAHPGLRRWEGERFHEGLAQAVRIRPSATMAPFFACRIVKDAP